MKKVLAIILGGGAGTRLYPLTKGRAKPAVSLAGKYRLIDIPVSNCINSEIDKIYVLTQFNSASLNRHISRTYNLGGFTGGFVEVLAAQQTAESHEWFQGTADAVRQYLPLLQEWDVDEYLILSGDHLYRMDYRQFVHWHRCSGADITLSVVPVDEIRASDYGLVQIDASGRVWNFSEKPEGNALAEMRTDTAVLGLPPDQAKLKPYIASMGIYVFKKEVLTKLLQESPSSTDFGKEIIPRSAKTYKIQSYLFNDYWEDIGTIKAFYKANLELTKHPQPEFSLYDTDAPILTRSRYLPPSKLLNCQVTESTIAEGCILKKCRVHRSVLGLRTRIESDCLIEDTLITGADFYESALTRQEANTFDQIPVGVGCNSTIKGAIIDKNARIGKHVQIINKDRVQEATREDEGFCICSGIVIVLKDAKISGNTII